MRRREFMMLLGGASAWPLAAHAQQPDRMRRVSVLMAYVESDATQLWTKTFSESLQELGLTRERDGALEQLSEALEQQTATSEVLKVISSSPGDLQPVFEAMLANATRLCEAKFGVLYRSEGDALRVVAMHGAPLAYVEERRRNPIIRPNPTTTIGRAVATKQTVQIADVLKLPHYSDPPLGYTAPQLPKLAGARTVLAVPMCKDDELVGIIAIYRQEVRLFTEKQIELVTNFAAQAVIAIENTRLLNELRQRTDDLSESLQQQTATSEVLSVISSSPGDLKPVFDSMLENATNICDANFGLMYLYDNEFWRPVALLRVPPKFSEWLLAEPRRWGPGTGLGRLAESKQLVQIVDVKAEDTYVQRDPSRVAFVELAGARTFVAVPLLKENQLIGAITIFRQQVRPFTDKQIALVQNFAAQAVIAIENTRLLNELRQRTDDLTESLEQQTATSEVLGVISSSPGELEPVFQTMLENATRICEAKFGTLYLCDADAFRVVAMHNTPPAYAEARQREPLVRPPPDSVLGRVSASKQVIHIADVREVKSYIERNPFMVAGVEFGGYRTALGVPLLKQDALIGVVSIYRQEVRPFTDKQIALVESFAAQAVIAIENTRLLNDLRQSLQQQTATADVLKVISGSTFDLQAVLDTLVKSATQLCEAQDAFIFLPSGNVFRVAARYGFTPEFHKFVEANPITMDRGSVVGRTAIDGRPVHISDVLADPEYTRFEPQKMVGWRAALGIPLLREGKVIGVMFLSRTKPQPFTEKQVELVTTFADQAVIAIENARLLNELRERTDDLAESLEQQTATSEVLGVISSSPGELEPVFQAMLENAVRICNAKFGVLYLYGGGKFHSAALANPSPEFEAFLKERGEFSAGPRTALGRIVETRQTVHIVDVKTEPAYVDGEPLFVAVVNHGGYRTVVSVPMFKENELIGAILIYRQEVRPFTDKQIALVQNSRPRLSSPSRTLGCSMNYVSRCSNRPPPPMC
jgi:GAF domain-containing protein